MSDLYWLTDDQMSRLQPYFPKSHGRPRVDDRRVLSGIIFVNRNRLRWRDALKEYGPAKTLYNRWKRWSDKGIFIRILEGLAQPQAADCVTIMIDAIYLKAHRTASSLGVKRGARSPDRSQFEDQETIRWGVSLRTGGMNTKLHAVTDGNGRPISFFMSTGQISDYTGAAALLDTLPKAQWLLGDRGYDADWFRDALQEKGIAPCIPGRKTRTKPVKYDKRRYKKP